uniref:AP-1 complex subunit sigma-2 n=1 Tax=Gouania willdenowi TaxID=441366 RepID=A0A8C5HTS9_GOUWI
MQFMLLFSRQGKLRLQKWYVPLSDKERKKISRDLVQTILARKPKMCSFLEWRDLKIVYKRYASLYFCCAVEDQDNELITLEIIHRYVELLDKYFGSVCELDIIFNFEKAYFILDEFLLGGEAQETSKKNVLKAIEQADLLQEVRFIKLPLFPSGLSYKPGTTLQPFVLVFIVFLFFLLETGSIVHYTRDFFAIFLVSSDFYSKAIIVVKKGVNHQFHDDSITILRTMLRYLPISPNLPQYDFGSIQGSLINSRQFYTVYPFNTIGYISPKARK